MSGKTVVKVPEELRDFIPSFIENRKSDLIKILSAVTEKRYDEVKDLGHQLKGVSGGYGFHELGNIGAKIEAAAKEEKHYLLITLQKELENHLLNIEIVYVNEEE